MADEPGVVAFSGQRFGVYELHECLGAGGMGDVYRARSAAAARRCPEDLAAVETLNVIVGGHATLLKTEMTAGGRPLNSQAERRI